MASTKVLKLGSHPGMAQKTPLVLSSSGSNSVMTSFTKSVTKSSRNLNTFFLSRFMHSWHYSSVMFMDSRALGRFMVVLHSGKPMQAMNTDPALEVLTFKLLFLHYGHYANSVLAVAP